MPRASEPARDGDVARQSRANLTADWQTVRLDTLVSVRWIAIAGQTLALLVVYYGLEYRLPLLPTAAMVVASAVFNLALTALYPGPRRLSDREATLHLAFDILQLAGLLYFTGGLENPFSLLIVVPVTISATNLSGRSTASLILLSMAAISVLALGHQPLPGAELREAIHPVYLTGIWVALMLGIPFTAIYAWRVADEARRRSEALAVTQLALARVQKLSAVGGLAAAAAHELGTPLGTISVVAKEISHDLPEDSPLADDVALLQSQAVRCREILANLSKRPEDSHEGHFGLLPVHVLIDEAAEPFADMDDSVTVDIKTRHGEGPEPRLPRLPEILHALRNFIENAIDFANSEVTLTLSWDDERLNVVIEDDGPGFPAEVLGELGEPYVTARLKAHTRADRHHEGLGLGIFIAKTLLERTGAGVAFANRAEGGARIEISWEQSKLEKDDVYSDRRWL